jgi:hypothetical protein
VFDVGLALSHRQTRIKCMESRPRSLQLKKPQRNTPWTGIRLKQLQSSCSIQLYRRWKRRNIKGQFSFPPGSRKCSSRLNRYIDQCQELLDAPATLGERKALEVYALAVQAARGDTHDYWPEEIPKEFFSYIERSSTQYLDGGKKEVLPVSFDYDRWLSGR